LEDLTMLFRLLPRNSRPRRHLSDRAKSLFRLETLEDRCLLSSITGYSEYPIPSGNIPWYTTTGPDGNLWFTEGSPGVNKVGMINPTTHAISEFSTPTTGSAPREITVGPDGNLWFTEWSGNKLARINPTTHAVTEFAIPSNGSDQPWGITAGPDGNLWFTEMGSTQLGVIGMFNLTTHTFSSFRTPSSNAAPHGITVGPDGNLWFAEYSANKIGEINPTTHVIKEFALPAGAVDPYDITASPDGNLWFTLAASNLVGTINPTTDAVTLYATPHASYGITAGPDGNLWFSDGQIASLSPTAGVVTQFTITGGVTRGITVGPDGNLWFTDSSTRSIGVAYLSGTSAAVKTNATSPGVTLAAPDPTLVPLVLGDAAFLDAIAAHKRHMMS
jgi:streptogramin lyase